MALGEIATISTTTGPAFIHRDNNARFIGVKFTVRDRDLGSTIAEAQKKVNAGVKFPEGYSVTWTGEFDNQVRASKRLGQVVPISLAAIFIFIILFIALRDSGNAGLVLVNVPFALIGGIFALHLTGMNFGISAGVGFIALFGICVQNGVILVQEFNDNLHHQIPLDEAIISGVRKRIRPVVMTALMASLGLLPAAMSTGIGSESQKPLAIVIIGGLITATVFILPVPHHVPLLPPADPGAEGEAGTSSDGVRHPLPWCHAPLRPGPLHHIRPMALRLPRRTFLRLDLRRHPRPPEVPVAALATFTRAVPVRGDRTGEGPRFKEEKGRDIPFDQWLKDHKTVAFLIIQRDTIKYERYFKGYDAAHVHPSFSMAKSVVSMLIGTAIADGYIRDVQQPLTDFIPELRKNGFDKVTIEHVLQMTSGIDFTESYVNPFGTVATFYYGRDLTKYTLKLKLKREPGTEWEYVSGDTQLLGLLLTRALRMKGDQRTLTQYLSDRIWTPLGMEYASSWSTDRKSDGIEKAFCCINAPGRDFAKLGSLFLKKGAWRGEQLVPRDWVETSTKASTENGGVGFYRYQWWLPSAEGDFHAEGILGQYVYVDPKRELVMVRLGSSNAGLDWAQVFRSLAPFY